MDKFNILKLFENKVIRSLSIIIIVILLLLVFKHEVLNNYYYFDAMGGVALPSLTIYMNGFSFFVWHAHTPLIYNFVALIWKIFSPSIFVSRILGWCFVVIAFLYIFKIGDYLSGYLVGLVSVLLIFFNQIMFAEIGLFHDSIFLLTFSCALIYYYIKKQYLLTSIMGILLVLSKETGALFLLAILVDYSFLRTKNYSIKKNVKNIFYFIFPVVILLIWLYFQLNFKGVFLRNDLVKGFSGFFGRIISLFFRFLFYDGTIKCLTKINWIFSGIIILLLFFMRKKLRKEYLLFSLILIFHIILFAYTSELSYYFVNIIPFYYLFFVLIFSDFLDTFTYSKYILVVITFLLILLSIHYFTGTRSAGGWDLTSNMEYLDQIKITEDAVNYINLHYPDKKIFTCWPEHQTFRIKSMNSYNLSLQTYTNLKYYKSGDIILYSKQSICNGMNSLFLESKNLVKTFSINNKIVSIYV